jgi:hypothetical protein
MSTVYCVTHESIFGEHTREFHNLHEALDWVGVIAENDGKATLTTETR